MNAAGQRQPFPGNLIPKSMQDPVAVNIQSLFPAPNQAGTGKYHQNNYFDGALYPNDAQKFDIRLDDYLSNKHQLFGRYSFAQMDLASPDHYHNGADPLYRISNTRGQNVILADNYTLNSSTVLQGRYSFTRHAEIQPIAPQAENFDLVKLGFPPSLASQSLLRQIPMMSISGMYGVGSKLPSTNFVFISQNHNASVSVDTIQGRHSLKMGFEYRKSFVNMGQPQAPSGQYQFDTTATSSKTYAGDGYGYASFLLGMGTPTSTTQSFSLDGSVAEASSYYGTYFQDAIRLTRNLTMNVGIRWEIFGGGTERYGRQETFDPTARYTLDGVQLVGGEVFPKGNSNPFQTNYHNFGPRLGVAYRAASRTVLHSGFGIFYGPSPQSVAIAATNSDSFSSRTRWNAVTTDAFGNTVMLNPLKSA